MGAGTWYLEADDPLAVAAVEAIHHGEADRLARLLAEHPGLAGARVRDAAVPGVARTLLHILADWPGHFPAGARTVAVLVAAGADVNARFEGPHAETALHGAASSDDVEVLDALLDAGADIEADGAVIAGGTALTDARAFGQWRAAHRLVERGARTTIDDDATLGLLDRLAGHFAGDPPPAAEDVNRALWGACHGGQLAAARYLVERGGDLNWIPPWERLSPLDAAVRSDAAELAGWLRDRGARPAAELP